MYTVRLPSATNSTSFLSAVTVAKGRYVSLVLFHPNHITARLTGSTRKYCLNHRTETAHTCPKAGEWARRAQQALAASYKPSPRLNILTHEQQCSDPFCKTLVNTPLVTGVHCDNCNRTYCLKHRFTYDHNCETLTPSGARPSAGPTQAEKGLAALAKLRAWSASKTSNLNLHKPTTSSRSSATARITATANLKKTAKGDPKTPPEKRIYLYVEASSETLTAKIPKGTFFYSADYSVGRTLDLAAKSLQVSNVNNQSSDEEDKLRVFHVEGGRLLDFSEKLAQCVATGNTVVLLRGVGAQMAKTPGRS